MVIAGLPCGRSQDHAAHNLQRKLRDALAEIARRDELRTVAEQALLSAEVRLRPRTARPVTPARRS